jgi:hypothetical protein
MFLTIQDKSGGGQPVCTGLTGDIPASPARADTGASGDKPGVNGVVISLTACHNATYFHAASRIRVMRFKTSHLNA